MNKTLCLGVAMLVAFMTGSFVTASDSYGSALSLEDAVVRTLEHSPYLKAATQRIAVAEGQVQQARLIPNPEFEWEGEEISGSRPLISESEHTFLLSQTIELGGKRSARTKRAESDKELAQTRLEALRLDLQSEVRNRFFEVLVAQRKLLLVSERIRLADSVSRATQRRVDAGAAATVEALRSRVAITDARLDSSRAVSDWINAKEKLSALWGSSQPGFDSVTGIIPALTAVPNESTLLGLSGRAPLLQVKRMEIEATRRDLTVAKSLGTPDLSIAAGPRFTTVDGAKSFVLGISLPLPLFNRNQGEIASASQAIAVGESEYEGELLEWEASLISILTDMSAAYDEAMTIGGTMLPQASTVFQEIERGYREGRFTYLELLAAEQDLINARARLLDAEAEYHRQRIDVERLIGRSLNELEESDAQ